MGIIPIIHVLQVISLAVHLMLIRIVHGHFVPTVSHGLLSTLTSQILCAHDWTQVTLSVNVLSITTFFAQTTCAAG